MSDSNSLDAYPPADWRVVVQPALDGALNMAIDEAIAEAVAAGRSLPTLRFYAWEPGCLSLGYAQPAADADMDALRAHGWDIVRRLTGGRAILHINELTYSIATPLDDPRVEGGIVESYRRLSRGLIAGLERLNAPVESGRDFSMVYGFDGPVCFEVPSDYEITAYGKKLLGSAQTRRGGVALQHGALPLFGDITQIVDALIFSNDMERDESHARLRDRAITLAEALSRTVEMSMVIEALIAGLASELNITLHPSDLSEEEQSRAAQLRAKKYANSDWTHRH